MRPVLCLLRRRTHAWSHHLGTAVDTGEKGVTRNRPGVCIRAPWGFNRGGGGGGANTPLELCVRKARVCIWTTAEKAQVHIRTPLGNCTVYRHKLCGARVGGGGWGGGFIERGEPRHPVSCLLRTRRERQCSYALVEAQGA
jgi:hypothetical protein